MRVRLILRWDQDQDWNLCLFQLSPNQLCSCQYCKNQLYTVPFKEIWIVSAFSVSNFDVYIYVDFRTGMKTCILFLPNFYTQDTDLTAWVCMTTLYQCQCLYVLLLSTIICTVVFYYIPPLQLQLKHYQTDVINVV